MANIGQGRDLIKVTISFHQKQMLRFLAERGGRTDFKFGRVSFKGDETKEQQDALIEQCRLADQSVRAMGKDPAGLPDGTPMLDIINITPIIGSDERYELTLNDRGRQIVDQMGLVVKPIAYKFDFKTKKEIKGQ